MYRIAKQSRRDRHGMRLERIPRDGYISLKGMLI